MVSFWTQTSLYGTPTIVLSSERRSVDRYTRLKNLNHFESLVFLCFEIHLDKSHSTISIYSTTG